MLRRNIKFDQLAGARRFKLSVEAIMSEAKGPSPLRSFTRCLGKLDYALDKFSHYQRDVDNDLSVALLAVALVPLFDFGHQHAMKAAIRPLIAWRFH